MMPQHAGARLALVGSLTLLIALALQYPLSTTFPLGGDAAFYVRTAKTLLSATPVTEKITLLKSSSYPLTYLVAALPAALPLDWPERFTWLVTLTYIAVGVCLGLFLYRLKDLPTAATGIAIWALAPIDITTHIEAGTFAQLLSLVFLALFFERLSTLSRRGILLAYSAVLLSHPLTGLLLSLTVLTVVVAIIPTVHTLPFRQRQIYWVLLGLTALSAGAVIFKLWINPALLTTGFETEAANFSLSDLVHSLIGPFLILVPLGFAQLAGRPRANQLVKMTLIVFCIITVLLCFNHLLGVGLLTYRFKSYFVFGTVVLSALAFPWVLRHVFFNPYLRGFFVTLFFISLAGAAWHNNSLVFRHYEAPGNYARLHPAEYAGIVWMKDNLDSDSVIITSNVNRHAEWIPALTSLKWLSLSQLNDEAKINNTLHEARVFGRPVYMALFLNAEEVPTVFPSATVVFDTKDFMLLQIRQ